jgi:serine/threonine-protein kinase RsbW
MGTEPVMEHANRTATPPSTLSLTIPAQAENLVFCRLALAGLARTHPIEPEALADLKLAVTEACSNSIRHAYGPDGGDGRVFVRFSVDAGRVAIEVEDTGRGFDPPSDSPAPAEVREAGMGLALIRTLTDELTITRGPNGRGSLLRFSKHV